MRFKRLPILLSLALLSPALACKDKEGEGDKKGDAKKKDDALVLTSPTLCKHIAELGHEKLADETSCIMRLDGLQIQLGQEDWKTHGRCIADAKAGADVDNCLNAADKASLEKSKAKAAEG